MKVCGFSFIRNGIKYDYPFEEAIRSILPLCEEIFVAVGNSSDDTVQRVAAIDPRVKIIETTWDENLREGGRVLAVETDKAFQYIPSIYDWAIYIQADEVLHEKYIPVVQQAMTKYLDHPKVDGLLFDYVHFFGSYDYVGASYDWYRKEIRVVRNRKDIYSYRDAQGFRKGDNQKLRVKQTDAEIYHYGWTRKPGAMKGKETFKAHIYGGHSAAVPEPEKIDEFEYSLSREPVKRFDATHPSVMLKRIREKNWNYQPTHSVRYLSFKDWLKRWLGKWTGWYPGEYKNYRII